MRTIVNLLFPALLLMFAAGCIFAPYHETMNYDLGPAAVAVPVNVRVDVRDFDNNSGAGRKILFRVGKYRMVEDGYSKWVQAPGALLGRYLTNAFFQSGKASTDVKPIEVSGELTAFEFDQDAQQFKLRGAYHLNSGTAGKIVVTREFNITIGYKQDNPAELVSAASNAALKLAEMIRNDIAPIADRKGN